MMERNAKRGIIGAGIMLIIIALYPFVKNVIITLIALSHADVISWDLFLKYVAISFKPIVLRLNYSGLDILLQETSRLLPLRHARTFNYISLIIIYLPLPCYIVLFASGIGVMMRKERLRIASVVTLSIMLALGIVNLIGLYIFSKKFYIDKILAILFFSVLIYYLIRLKIYFSSKISEV